MPSSDMDPARTAVLILVSDINTKLTTEKVDRVLERTLRTNRGEWEPPVVLRGYANWTRSDREEVRKALTKRGGETVLIPSQTPRGLRPTSKALSQERGYAALQLTVDAMTLPSDVKSLESVALVVGKGDGLTPLAKALTGHGLHVHTFAFAARPSVLLRDASSSFQTWANG